MNRGAGESCPDCGAPLEDSAHECDPAGSAAAFVRAMNSQATAHRALAEARWGICHSARGRTRAAGVRN
jgi:hypothetical protein